MADRRPLSAPRPAPTPGSRAVVEAVFDADLRLRLVDHVHARMAAAACRAGAAPAPDGLALADPDLLGRTATCLGRRVLPAIHDAFGVRVTRIETPRVARLGASWTPRPGAACAEPGDPGDLIFAVWVGLDGGGLSWRLRDGELQLAPGAALIVMARGAEAVRARPPALAYRTWLFDEDLARRRQTAAAGRRG